LDNEQEEQGSQALIPIVQETILFHGQPLVVVRLPDGQPGVVLRWICENLHVSSAAQVERIKRTEVIADGLVYVRIQTDGGPQVMPTLVLRSVPYWLATIDTRRMRKDDERRLEILSYQHDAVDALYIWAASALRTLTSPTSLVPAEQITKPTPPTEDASLDERREYHRMMVLWIDWQHAVVQWRGDVESRLEGLEAVTSLILEQVGPQTLTPAHQNQVKYYVQQLSKAMNKHLGTIYSSLYTAFSVPRYQDIPEAEWDKVENWFKVQMERAKKK
jgi:hypothetical protein